MLAKQQNIQQSTSIFNKNRNILKLIFLFIILFLTNLFLNSFFRYFDDIGIYFFIYRFFESLTYFLLLLIVIMLGIHLTKKFFVSSTVNFAISDEDIVKKVKELFNSDQFFTTLKEAIPTGKNNIDYGFDFIPFMLKVIDEKKVRLEKSSRNFLRWTFILGIFFSVVITIFAYFIINEEAAGTPKTLSELRSISENLNESIQKITKDKGEKFIVDYIQPLRNLPANEKSNATDNLEKYYINSNKLDLVELQKVLTNNNSSETLKGLSEPTVTKYKQAVSELDKLLSDKNNAELTLPRQREVFDETIKRATVNFDKPENRTPDIVKRISVSLVLATFFIAILRYVVKLYRDHYQQLTIAEQDHLAIRKFYVAFKSAKTNDQRQAVLTLFMASRSLENLADSGDSDSFVEILKEFASAVGKKIS